MTEDFKIVLCTWCTEKSLFKGLTPIDDGAMRMAEGCIATAIAPRTRSARRPNFEGSSLVDTGRDHGPLALAMVSKN